MPRTPLAFMSSGVSILGVILLYIFIFRPFEEKRPNLVKDLLQKWEIKLPASQTKQTEMGK